MPFVRIDLAKGRSTEIRKSIGEIVYQAMIEVIDVPVDDKFQIISNTGQRVQKFRRLNP